MRRLLIAIVFAALAAGAERNEGRPVGFAKRTQSTVGGSAPAWERLARFQAAGVDRALEALHC